MTARHIYLLKIIMYLIVRTLFERQLRITYYRVHRGADIMRHIEQKTALSQAALYRPDLFTFDGLMLYSDSVLHIKHHR